MGVVFVALIGLQLSIYLIAAADRWATAREQDPGSEANGAPAPPTAPAADLQVTPDVIAAIGAALALAEAESAPSALTPAGAGRVGTSWVQSGRLRQMTGRTGTAIERRSH